MSSWLAIAIGGAVGAVLRHAVSLGVHRLLGRGFPWGTLAVNVVGSLAMGLLFVWLTERSTAAPATRALLLVGVLGAFTTFSTFSLETVNLIEAGRMARAFGNVTASVALCVAAAWLGILIGRS